MPDSDSTIERRRSRRFQLSWDMSFIGNDLTGSSFEEAVRLLNLSSSGAYFLSPKTVSPGATVELRIRVPFKNESWMKYSGQVVRLVGEGIAVKFDEPRPIFAQRKER